MDSTENKEIELKGYTFEVYIPEDEIYSIVVEMAAKIQNDYKGKNPLFIIVLSGAFIFAADLLRNIDIENDITFVKLKTYDGFNSTKKLNMMLASSERLVDRHVVIIEDIVDTGYTLDKFLEVCKTENPKSLEIVSLLVKREALIHPLEIKYSGRDIPNDFVIGYGLDYNGKGRNLTDIYKIKDSTDK
jgi:hypoxanthine phosphoribosyltransferase